MRKLAGALVSLCLPVTTLGFLALNGCEGVQGQADKDAQAKAQTAQKAHDGADPSSLDQLEAVQKQYDALVSSPNISPAMSIVLRGQQAEVRFERVMLMLAGLRNQELEIARVINDIERLGSRVAGAQESVGALKDYDPTPSIQALMATEAKLTGSADKPTWSSPAPTPDNPAAVVNTPTLAKLSADIAALNAAIAKNKSDTNDAHATSAKNQSDAETLVRQSESETGDSQVQDSIKAAGLRRDAAVADATAEALASELARLQSDLDAATQQKAAEDATLATLGQQLDALKTGAKKLQEQVAADQKLQQTIIGTDNDSADAVTIAAKANALVTLLTNAAATRDTVNGELNALKDQFDRTSNDAIKLRNTVMKNSLVKSGDPDSLMRDQMKETLHPANYLVQKAAAEQALASVSASKTAIDVLIEHMLDGYQADAILPNQQFKALNATTTQPSAAAATADASGSGLSKLGGLVSQVLGAAATTAPSDTAMAPSTQPASVATQSEKIAGLLALLDKQKTGVDMPKALANLGKLDADTLKKSQDDVDALFREAITDYEPSTGYTDSGPGAELRAYIALKGHALTNRQAGLFFGLVGDKEKEQSYQAAAKADEAQFEPKFSDAITGGTEQPAAGTDTGTTPTSGTPTTPAAGQSTPAGTPAAAPTE